MKTIKEKIMKTTKEKIEVMQAYERGEQIQINNSNNMWEDIETPIWDWVNCNYRVKPKKLDEAIESNFKDGDILFVKSRFKWIIIYRECEDKSALYKYISIDPDSNKTYINFLDITPVCNKEDISKIRLATEEEKEKLFKAIRDNGYKWNQETKTLEKSIIPKFKVGDVVQHGGYKVVIIEVNTDDEWYRYNPLLGLGLGGIPFSKQERWELVPDKFDITTLKPFDKVLVRQDDELKWVIDFFGFPKEGCYYTTGNHAYVQCIPYEENKHLLGTTNDCDDFYKNW